MDTAIWLKNISNGICHEEVAKKGPPTTASGIKTFRKIWRFDQLIKFITLCIIDINQKIIEMMETFKIYPTIFMISYKDNLDGLKSKTQRHPMMPLDEFQKNPRSLVQYAIPFFKSHENQILPAASVGATVTNFKEIAQIRKEQNQKIGSFFKKVDKDNISE